MDVRFVLHHKDTFEKLVHDAGFKTETIYGDYDRSPFEGEASPFMIWILRKSVGTAE